MSNANDERDAADGMAELIIDRLKSRSGVGNELEQIDDEIMSEILAEIAEIIRSGQ